MSDKNPKQEAWRESERIIASDDMFTVHDARVHVDPRIATHEDMRAVLARFSPPPFDEELAADLETCRRRLGELGWPAPNRSVLFWRDEDGREQWREVSPEEAHEAGVSAMLARDPRIGVMHGATFILKRSKPLEDEAWWLARIAELMRRILDMRNTNRRLFLAVRLGRLQQQHESHRAYLRLVKQARSHNRRLAIAALEGADTTQKKARVWHEAALREASEIRARHPECSASAAALFVKKTLGNDYVSASKKLPSLSRIRKVIAPLWREG